MAAACALVATMLVSDRLLADVPTPVVSLPPVGTHGFPFMSEVIDLASQGYVEDEVFIEGTARSYVPVAPLTGITDGRWDATPTGPTASYKTRLLIRRPTNPHKFNGIVLVDWMNVTSGYDSDIFGGLSSELMGAGYAYVGVSAQAVGVNFLRNTWETGPDARYASLVHPGDSHSYDIYSQAAQALLDPGASGPAPLGNLTSRIEALVTIGASQSGGRLITYANAVQPDAGLYSGFVNLIANNGAALSQAPLPAVPVPSGASSRIRTDSDTPYLHINSETEFIGSARGLHAQPDGGRFRIWEIAGAAHATKPNIDSTSAKRAKSGLAVGVPDCGSTGINDMDVSVVIKAGVRAMWIWVAGRAPTTAARIELSIPETGPVTIIRNPATGIAEGGLRVPDVTAPIRTLWGTLPPGAPPFCFLFGAVDNWNGDTDAHDGTASDLTPTPEPSLLALYKKKGRYVAAVTLSALRLTIHGHLLPRDALQIITKAIGTDIP